MSIKFTQAEIEYLQTDPNALRAAAMYHEWCILDGESQGHDCFDDIARQKELMVEAARIEENY